MSFYVRESQPSIPRIRYQWTITLLIANVVIFVLTYSISDYGISEYWVSTLAQNNALVLVKGEWWRLFTAMWLHADIMHVSSNMVGLLLFGISLENIVRWWQYLIIYLAAGLLGNIGSLFLIDPGIYSLGASGCVFGILAAAILGGHALTQQNLCMAFVYIALYIGRSSGPGVNDWAHILGAIAGVVLILAFTRKTALHTPRYARNSNY